MFNTSLSVVCWQVEITVLDSDTRGIVFLGAPYSFYTVDGVSVNYTVGAVQAIDLQTNSVDNITYRIVSNNDSCTCDRVGERGRGRGRREGGGQMSQNSPKSKRPGTFEVLTRHARKVKRRPQQKTTPPPNQKMPYNIT